MSILVVGSVAFDTIETPQGRRDRCLGGAATYFSLSASYFTDVRVIAVVGEDFTAEHEAVLTRRGVDTQGLEHTAGKSFHWTGSYVKSLNEAQTLNTELNVFESFAPKVPAAYKDSEFLFLANIDPVLQSSVRQQMPKVRMVCGDTMNYWITGHRDNLAKVLTGLDALLINDGEAKLLADNSNLVLAARKILAMGPKALIVKHGEYGATAFFGDQSFDGAASRQGGDAFSGSGIAAGPGGRSHRCRRFIRRRLLWIPRLATRGHLADLQTCHVLRWRNGLLCGAALWYGTDAIAHARGDRSALRSLPRAFSS